jgi:hypothetical protein
MARQKKDNDDGLDPAYRELKDYRRKELQKECIKMGIPFPNVCDFSQTQLMSWFIKNWKDPKDRDKKLLEAYDEWFLYEMMKKNYDPRDPKVGYLFHPAMQMATQYSEDEAETEELLKLKKSSKTTKPKASNKPARVKDESGIVKGTKKSLTIKLAKEGLDVAKIIKRVKKEFPEANESSIKIWAKRLS